MRPARAATQSHPASAWALLGAALACAVALPSPARAGDTEGPGEAPQGEAGRQAPAPRPVPDYDGRGEEPTTAGEVLLWVPRILLSPFYLVTEFVLRQPLGWLVSDIEEGGSASFLVDVFRLGKSQDFGIVPTAHVELGFRANAGLYLFLDNFPVEGNHLRVHGATGGIHWWKLTVVDRIPLSSRGAVLSLRGHASTRRDHVFAGFGPSTTGDQVGRYESNRLDGTLGLEIPGWAASRMRATMGVRDRHYDPGECCGDPSIHTRIDQGRLPGLPPAFEEGYTAWHQQLTLAVDSRGHNLDDGFRVEVFGEQGFDLADRERRWVRYGGTAGVYLPTLAATRILSLVLGARFVDSIAEEAPPFEEQQLLGGEALFQGFRPGRLHGRSALVGALRYEWPVWIWLSGFAEAAAGNVFGPHLEDLRAERLRGSFAFGLRTPGERDHAFELLVGLGTETVEQGFRIDTVRVAVGGTEGF